MGQAYYGCYTPWATKVVFNGTEQNGMYYNQYEANGQPGLAAVSGNLVLTWGDQNSNYLYSSYSWDGIVWSPEMLVSSSPQVNTSMYDAPPPYASGGVNMTVSPSCGYAYVGFVDPTGQNIYVVATSDGTWWYGPYLIATLTPQVSATNLPASYNPPPTGYFSTSAPALYGSDPNVVRFAFPQLSSLTQVWQPGKQNDSGGWYTYGYTVQVGQFGCSTTNPVINPQVLPSSQQCFFLNPGTGACNDSTNYGLNIEYDEGWIDATKPESDYQGGWVPSGPWSPLWTGAVYNNQGVNQVVELQALAQGNPLGNLNPPIWYSTYNETTQQYNDTCVGAYCAPPSGGYGIYQSPPPPGGYPPALAGPWSNNGIGGAVNPADGTAWLVFSCRDFDGDTCQNNPWIQFYHVSTGSWCSEDTARYGTGEWSISMPAMTFWAPPWSNGQVLLWLAWRGEWESGNGSVAVASILPSNIGWNGSPGGGGGGCQPPPNGCVKKSWVWNPDTCSCQPPTQGPMK